MKRMFLWLMVICNILPLMAWAGVTAAVLDPVSLVRNEKIDARFLGEYLQSALVQTKAFSVVERGMLLKVLEEQKLEMSGITESKASEVGQLLGADKLLLGTVSKLEREYFWMMKWVDAKTGVVEWSQGIRSTNVKGLLSLLPAVASNLAAHQGVTVTNAQPALPAEVHEFSRDGLVLELTFDGDFKDQSGIGNYGSPSGTVWAADRQNRPRHALQFKNTITYFTTSIAFTNPFPLTLSLWFNTETARGGRMLGFSSTANDMSEYKDRHLYMDVLGRVWFGVYNAEGERKSIRGSMSYNDGNWHHAAAVFSTNGIKLYVDGELQASEKEYHIPYSYPGFWRIGYDMMNRWPGEPDLYSFQGLMDCVRVYHRELSEAEILELSKE